MNTDLIIIGAGPGGYRAAQLAARQGLKVVIIEHDQVGGTCLNRGCIPTKTFVHAATFAEAVQRMPQVVAQLRAGVEQILSHPAITLLRGTAAFTSPRTVTVTPAANDAGSSDCVLAPQEVSAPAVIIATGSSPKMLPLPDIGDERLVDSTGLFQLTTLPRRLAIIGAGVVGMEFAGIFQRFGSEVTVIEYLKECLPMLDADIAKRLRKLMEKPFAGPDGRERSGITFRMKTAVESLADIDADLILMATGRRPNTEGLNLAAAGIALPPGAPIPTDDHMQVVLPPSGQEQAALYAIGDVNGRQMLAHAAEAQARIAVGHILASRSTSQPPVSPVAAPPVVPAAIFTTPEAACVGPAEQQLKAQGVAYECRKAFHRANGKALAMNQTEGMLKLFSEPGAGRILGCHAYGAHAADLIQEASVLMCRDTTVEQLRSMVHIHPSLSEILLSAACQ